MLKRELMDTIAQQFLRFTGKNYSISYKVLSLMPGTIVFLGVTPFVLFYISRFLTSFVPFTFSQSFETVIGVLALILAMLIMNWAMLSLWITGDGTPAPITPTKRLVTTGLYRVTRNPIELGTGFYFLSIGTRFDGLLTGILCQIFGMILGYGYIKLIEERELKLRFGKVYEEYLISTPIFIPNLFSRGRISR